MNKLKRKFGKRMKYNYKRTFFAMFLFLLLLSFFVGYSYLTTNLSIDGVSNVKSARWDVHFENVQVKEGSVSAATPTISNQTTASFNATLEEPGDFYEFTLDVVNDGTLDAKIGNINITPILTEEQKEYFSYTVTYVDGIEIAYGDALNVGATETILIRVEYKQNDDNSLYPDEDVEFDFSVNLDYEQGHGETVRTYIYGLGSYFELEKEVPNSGSGIYIYNSYEELMAANPNTPAFLRHRVKNNIIKETYLGFVYNNNIYYLRGAKVNGGTNPYFTDNINVLINAFGAANCSVDYNSYCVCTDQATGLTVNTISDGHNSVNLCHTSGDGTSRC